MNSTRNKVFNWLFETYLSYDFNSIQTSEKCLDVEID
jgi:hypothetical protein